MLSHVTSELKPDGPCGYVGTRYVAPGHIHCKVVVAVGADKSGAG